LARNGIACLVCNPINQGNDATFIHPRPPTKASLAAVRIRLPR
jgi:hypothetical protein